MMASVIWNREMVLQLLTMAKFVNRFRLIYIYHELAT